MPKATMSGSPPFSCDLVANARLHVLFLRAVHMSNVSLRQPSAESIRRYNSLWLPLVAASAPGDAELIPPIDVAWLWHCHRLAPYDYGRYARRELGVARYLEAGPPFALQCPEGAVIFHGNNNKKDVAQHTRHLWSKAYADEPFFAQEDVEEPSDDTGYGMLHNFDLVGSCERQATFLWQVTQERFGVEEFLEDGVEAYYKFLKLRSTEQGKEQIIVPTYQIDLMWHTHILSSLAGYEDDCKKIIGRTLHHDDSLNDRSEDSTLNRAFDATQQMWKEFYGEEYVVVGGMYRGEPPKEYYSSKWAISHLENDEEMPLKWPVISPEVEGTVVNRHRIMGASSTGKTEYFDVDGFGALDGGDEGGDRVEEGPWLKPTSTLPNGEKCFISASVHSKKSKEKQDGYIYGHEELGFGYYHVRTKEAYKILMVRVDKRIRAKESDLGCVNLWNCFCPSSPSARAKQTKLREELNELTEVRGVLEARYRANSPTGVVGLPQEITANAARNYDESGNPIAARYYDESGNWIFPVAFYNAGGGCGTAIDGLGFGGGCGGGGCGGGGGGCGGGGCGGGGCGGGG